MASPAARVLEHELLVYRRAWRGASSRRSSARSSSSPRWDSASAASSTRARHRRLHAGRERRGPRRGVVPGLPRPGAPRLDGDADGGLRVDVPGHGRDRLGQELPRDAGDADPHRRRRRRASSTYIGLRILIVTAVFFVVSVAFGAIDPAGGRPRGPRGAPHRRRLRCADRRVLRDAEGRERLQQPLPLRGHPALPLLRDVLPDQPAPGAAPAGRGPDAPLARRRPVPLARPRDRRAAPQPCPRGLPRDDERARRGGGPHDVPPAAREVRMAR